MRLYLSSFRLGTEPQHLVDMVRGDGRIAVVTNAIDDEPADIRAQKTDDECRALARLGLRPVELDLRTHFGGGVSDARRVLDGFDALWVRGGNVFVLRRALAESSFDDAICEALAEDTLVYSGYSAGPCVLAPTLNGLETVDDISGVERAYGLPPLMSGLGVLDRAVLPHVDGADPLGEAAALDRLALQYREAGVPYLGLRDGQALVIDGERSDIAGQPVAPEALLYRFD
jgi:dipeptidase E